MRLLDNPEVRKDARIGMLLIGLILVGVFAGIWRFEQKVELRYVESHAAIAGTLLRVHPQMRSELIPLLTKMPTEEQLATGMQILQQYGYESSLNAKLILPFHDAFQQLYLLIGGLLLLVTLCFVVYQYRRNRYIYSRVRELTSYADHVLDGRAAGPLPEMREGDFSKLAHSFNRMRLVIQRNIEDLKSEKQFLVQLMSDISHQLKTPLAALTMYNEILSERDVSTEQRTLFLDHSKQQLERMNWLIQSLLKLAKLDVGAIEFQREPRSIQQTVHESVEMIRGLAVQRGVVLVAAFHSEDEVCLMKHDKEWMIEALLNVLKNGIEHTPAGGTVRVELETGTTLCRIHIQDQGEGIERSEIPHIFNRFYKGKKNNKSGSVGIGLSLSKSIVEGHGGVIDVQSGLGEGTRFTFLIPQ